MCPSGPSSLNPKLASMSLGRHNGSVEFAIQNTRVSCVFFRLALKASIAPRNFGDTNAFARVADSSALTRLSRSCSASSKQRPPPAAILSSTKQEARATSSCGSTTSRTSPASRASAALGTQFSSPSMRCAAASPMRSGKVTDEQPSGGTPSLAKGSEKVAAGEAKHASIRQVEVTAAPMAGPLTAATIGFGKSRKQANSLWLRSRICRIREEGAIGLIIAERSAPAE
mmetsp:Transcript_3813/g.11261  ORF Transcript_3813/g.11261 Transcript_3813/m.11261 type:complete len:228 (+) Transcript_3813:155-838(+)